MLATLRMLLPTINGSKRQRRGKPRVFVPILCKIAVLTLVAISAQSLGRNGRPAPIPPTRGRASAGDDVTPSHASFNVNAMLAKYAHDYAPLTPFGADLVTALQSMDADLAAATAPVARATKNGTVLLHPIGFSLPPTYVRAVVPPKGQALATVIPGRHETYKYVPRAGHTPTQLTALERDYYADMERSLFGLTWKKAGWDCMRHLELLAAGCLPLFTDIDRAPPGAVAFLPKRVLSLLLSFPGVRVTGSAPGLPKSAGAVGLAPAPAAAGTATASGGARTVAIGGVNIDPVMYTVTVTALLDYTRRHLTTPAMAAHLLTTMGFEPPQNFKNEDAADDAGHDNDAGHPHIRRLHMYRGRHLRTPGENSIRHVHAQTSGRLRVLYLSLAKDTNDYMADTLLHGLVTLLGPDAVTQHHRRDVMYVTPSNLHEGTLARSRASLYGFGFSYGNTLFDLQDAATVKSRVASTEASLRAAISAREFDVVIFSLIHRGRPPLMDVVCASYPPSRVAAVHGHDTPPTNADLAAYSPCAGYFFAREAM